jgi:hypothetical protein
MLYFVRPSFEVVREGRIFLTEKMSWKYSSHLLKHHPTNTDAARMQIFISILILYKNQYASK